MQRDVPTPTPAPSPSPSLAPVPSTPPVNANTTAALVPQARLTGEAFASFADFSEDLEPTRAMQREDIPNEPMPLARRASKSHPSPSTAPHDATEEPLYPEASTPEVVDFNERMKSEPPTQVVPAPRVSKFVAPPLPAPTPPPVASVPARSAAPSTPAAAPAKKAAVPAKPLPPKPLRTAASASDDASNRATVDSTSGAVVPVAPAVAAPTPAAPEVAEAKAPRSVRRPARHGGSDRGQTGALFFLGVCAIAAAGLIGLSVGRSTVPTPMAGTSPDVVGVGVGVAQGSPAQPAAQPVAVAATTTATAAAAPLPLAPTAQAAGTQPPPGTPIAAAQPIQASKSVGAARPAEREAKPAPTEPEPAAQDVPADGPALPPFDASSATSALSALAGAVVSCGDGAGGTARVAVTFAPSGRVTQAIVEGAPYAGTPAGGCIAAKARAATVPPFAGKPTTVRRTYTMN
jgi:hypothetical protein